MIVEVDLRPETKERKTEFATPPPAKDEQWRWTMQKPQIRKKQRIKDKAPKTSKDNLWRDVGYMSLNTVAKSTSKNDFFSFVNRERDENQKRGENTNCTICNLSIYETPAHQQTQQVQ